uniref:(northern house mosquito) hypothetical protein n=1 Tax=Culex pipiens TaxID=7175 RepID=A0A8D8L2X3_CULPI
MIRFSYDVLLGLPLDTSSQTRAIELFQLPFHLSFSSSTHEPQGSPFNSAFWLPTSPSPFQLTQKRLASKSGFPLGCFSVNHMQGNHSRKPSRLGVVDPRPQIFRKITWALRLLLKIAGFRQIFFGDVETSHKRAINYAN